MFICVGWVCLVYLDDVILVNSVAIFMLMSFRYICLLMSLFIYGLLFGYVFCDLLVWCLC